MTRWFRTTPIFLFALLFFIFGCEPRQTIDATHAGQIPQDTPAALFRIDACTLYYRDMPLDFNAPLEEWVKKLGEFDRKVVLANDIYVWDALGVQIYTRWNQTKVLSINMMYAREVTAYEENLTYSTNPADKTALADITSSVTFFDGGVILEGALVAAEIDFESLNKIRKTYLAERGGADSQYIPIKQSYSPVRYGFERFCQNGSHLRYVFYLLTPDEPHRIGTLTIGTNESGED